jgi:predicted 3-demethylubiquinone-9 3-methyltransferase (glyoxalase superfamily)
MTAKNAICLWFDKDAQEAARFYAATFPDSEVTEVHEAPGDYPGGKRGDVLTVEFTAPVLIGDTIVAEAEAVHVHETWPVTPLKVRVTREAPAETVLEGEAWCYTFGGEGP